MDQAWLMDGSSVAADHPEALKTVIRGAGPTPHSSQTYSARRYALTRRARAPARKYMAVPAVDTSTPSARQSPRDWDGPDFGRSSDRALDAARRAGGCRTVLMGCSANVRQTVARQWSITIRHRGSQSNLGAVPSGLPGSCCATGPALLLGNGDGIGLVSSQDYSMLTTWCCVT